MDLNRGINIGFNGVEILSKKYCILSKCVFLPLIKFRQRISLGYNTNCVKLNGLCYNNTQSRSSLDLLLSHLFICSIFTAMHNTSNKNYPNYPLFTPCAVYVCVCFCLQACVLVCTCLSVSVCERARISLLCVMICQFPNSPARWVQQWKSPLCCLFHLLVIHNNFLDGEIIALEPAAISEKTTGNKHQIMMKRASN